MFHVLAETTAAASQADGAANALAMVLFGAIFVFIVLVIMGSASNGGGSTQPPPHPGGGFPVARPRAPINIDLEIDRVDVLRGPGASSGPRRPLN